MSNEERARTWAQRLADQADSGLSKQSYCAGHGIKPSTFYYWQRKLSVDGRGSEGACLGFSRITPSPRHELVVYLPEGELTLGSDSPTTLAYVLKELAHA